MASILSWPQCVYWKYMYAHVIEQIVIKLGTVENVTGTEKLQVIMFAEVITQQQIDFL